MLLAMSGVWVALAVVAYTYFDTFKRYRDEDY